MLTNPPLALRPKYKRGKKKKGCFFVLHVQFVSVQVVIHMQLLCVAVLSARLQPSLQRQGEGQVAVPVVPGLRGPGGAGVRL